MALLHRQQLFLGKITAVNPTFTTVYTVAAGYRFVIKAITVRNLDSVNANNAYVEVNGLLVWSTATAVGGSSGSFVQLLTDIVLAAGDVVSVSNSRAAGTVFTMSGSLYSI